MAAAALYGVFVSPKVRRSPPQLLRQRSGHQLRRQNEHRDTAAPFVTRMREPSETVDLFHRSIVELDALFQTQPIHEDRRLEYGCQKEIVAANGWTPLI